MKTSKLFFVLLVLGISFTLIHCKKRTTDLPPPEVETGEYSIELKIATGKIKRVGGGIREYGHLIDTLPEPTISQSIQEFTTRFDGIDSPDDTFAINSRFDQLSPVKTYYIRAYAIDIFGNAFHGENHQIVVEPGTFTEACFISDRDRCELPDCNINFDASCSLGAVSYKWDFDGDGVFDKAGNNRETVNFNYTTPGPKSVRLRTITDTNIFDDTVKTILVYGIGTTLVPCFITDTTECSLGDCTINFDASCSFNAIDYKWDFDNDGLFEEAGEDKEVVSHTYTSTGIFTAKLEATGLNGNKDTVTTNITVNEGGAGSLNPTACFTVSDTMCETDCLIYFDASCSSDDVIDYKWDFTGDGIFQLQGSNEILTSYIYTQGDTFTPMLVVRKDNNIQDTFSTSIVVINTEMLPPTACFSISPETPNVDDTIIFDATCSENALIYRWDFDGDGVFETSGNDKEIVTHTYDAPGNYTAVLSVENAHGDIDETEVTVQVNIATPIMPTACFAASESTCSVDCSVTFDASCSVDAALYRWDFNDDGVFDVIGSGDVVTNHAYTEVGTYTIRLQVESIDGSTDEITTDIQVDPAAPIIPVACFVSSESACTIDCPVNFDASCSEDAFIFRWDFNDDGVFDESGISLETVGYTYTQLGTYTVRLQVQSSDGTTSEATQNIQVSDCVVQCPNDIITNTNPGVCDQTVNWQPPVIIGNCMIGGSTHNPGDVFSVGTTTVTYTIFDPAGNTSNCSFDIVVEDVEPPFINCPADISVTTMGADAPVSWAISAFDNCGIADSTNTHNSGDIFPLGTTTVLYIFSDATGNASTCDFDVTVSN